MWAQVDYMMDVGGTGKKNEMSLWRVLIPGSSQELDIWAGTECVPGWRTERIVRCMTRSKS
jgi:hypothetical protein